MALICQQSTSSSQAPASKLTPNLTRSMTAATFEMKKVASTFKITLLAYCFLIQIPAAR